MKKRAVYLSIFLSLSVLVISGLSAEFTTANFTPLPQLPEPIYVRSNGTVEPSTAPLQRSGDTYTLTNNINNSIEVQRSNIVLNGNGYTVTKPSVDTSGLMTPIGWLPGLHVLGMSNVTITNFVFENCVTAITIENSTNIIAGQNSVRDTLGGVVILSSSNIDIIGNNMTLINQSFATGMNFLSSNPNAPTPTNITIKDNLIQGTNTEVPLIPPQPEQYGIWGGYSNSRVIGNQFMRIEGIAMYYTGSNNIIAFNSFQNNYDGLFFTGSQQYSNNNTIYCNNFDRNSANAVVPWIRDSPINSWDNGTVGNYWSDYKGIDANGDGIGDTPYVLETTYHDYTSGKDTIVQEGIDNFPLMTPLELPKGTVEIALQPSLSPTASPSFPTPANNLSSAPTVSILSSLNNTFFNVSIEGVNYQSMYKTYTTLSWVGYSIDGANNVTVTGNSTFVHDFDPSGYHTLTVYANDTSGNWATPQTVTYLVNFYTELTPTPHPTQQLTSSRTSIPPDYHGGGVNALLLILCTVVVVIAVVVGTLVYFKKRKGWL